MDTIVGTAGHIDHGKTALVKALTGTDTDRLPEEKKRGITIDLGFAEMEAGGERFGFVDVPGHERFVKNMLAGASGIDLVMLVVAADEGVMPQTREHFDICRLLDVQAGIVVLTKRDLVDDEILDLVRLETAELVAGSFLENAPVITVSAKTGKGIDALRESLVQTAAKLPSRKDHLVARLPIDRCFTKKGFGAVVTGTLFSGEIAEGDELDLLPVGKRVRVRGLQTHGRMVRSAHAGQRTAVNLAGIDHTEVMRGMLLAERDLLRPTQAANAHIKVLADAKRALRSRQRIRVHIGSAEALARVSILNESGETAPGESGFAQLRFETPVVAIFGERFVIRSYSPQVTIAGGQLIEPMAERVRRRDFEAVTENLKEFADSINEPERLLKLLVESFGVKGIVKPDVRARTGWTLSMLGKTFDAAANRDDLVATGDLIVARRHFDTIKEVIVQEVEAFHKREPLARGFGREVLPGRIRTAGEAVLETAISELVSDKLIALDGEVIRIAARKNELTNEEAAVKERLLGTYQKGGIEPPKLDEVLSRETRLPPAHARRVFQLLIDSREVVKVTDEFYFSGAVLEKLKTKLRAHADKSSARLIDVAKFKELAGVSRKYAIPLLEYFDREKVTVRNGDKRLIL